MTVFQSNSRQVKILCGMLFLGFSLSACGSPEEKEARYIKRGNELFDEGQFEKARVEYKNALRLKPADPEVAYRIGLIDDEEGDFRNAFSDFNRAEQQNDKFIPAVLKLGQYYLAADQFDEVQKRVDKVMALSPDDPGAHALHAGILLHDKDLDGAEKEARFALARNSKNIVPYSVLITLYVSRGDIDQAIKVADEGIAANPHDLGLLLLKAKIFEKSNDLSKIAATYNAIFALAPTDSRYRIKLASYYLKAGDTDNAEKSLRSSIEALPDNWDLRHDLVLFLYDQRGLQAAENEINQEMEKYPGHKELNNWLVDLYVAHGDIPKAVGLLHDIIAMSHNDAEGLTAQTALARIDFIQGDKDTAQKIVLSVLAQNPNNLDARFLKARIEADRGFYQDSVSDLRMVLRDQPRAKEALHLMAEVFFRQGHTNLAIDTLNQLVELEPLDYAARVRLAELYHLNGDSKKGMDILFFVTKANPKYPIGWEATGRIAIELKDWSTALLAIQSLDGLPDQRPTADYLKGEMELAQGQNDQASAIFKSIIEANPKSPVSERALLSLVADLKAEGKAGEIGPFIASLKDKTPLEVTMLGETDLAAGKTDDAAQNFDLAITQRAEDQGVYLDRASMFLSSKNTDQALETLKKGALAVPNDMRASLMEAQILGDLGRYQEAIALYENLLDRNPDLDTVANNLAEIIADFEYTDPKALAHAANVVARFSAASNPLLLDTVAWVDYRLGNIAEAQAVMERGLATKGILPAQVHYHYGAILVRAGDKAKAKSELQQATTPNAAYPGLEDAKKLLETL